MYVAEQKLQVKTDLEKEKATDLINDDLHLRRFPDMNMESS